MYSNTKSKYKYKEINLSTVLLFQCFPVFFNIYCTIQASFEVKRNHDLKWVHLIVNISVIFIKTSLLNKTPQVPHCPSALQAPECTSVLVPLVPFECPSASSAAVTESLECPSALGVYLECPWSAPLRLLKCPSSALWAPSALWVLFDQKKVCSITGNGFLNSFVEFFKKFSEYNKIRCANLSNSVNQI